MVCTIVGKYPTTVLMGRNTSAGVAFVWARAAGESVVGKIV